MKSLVVSEENVVDTINSLKKNNKIIAITILYEEVDEDINIVIDDEPQTVIDRPPKRHANAYIHFVNDKRKEIVAVNPNLKVVEVSKIIGDMWKKSSDDEKKKYWNIAEQDKIRYKNELWEYQQQHPDYSYLYKR